MLTRKFRQKAVKAFNGRNLSLAGFSVLAGYSVVGLCGLIPGQVSTPALKADYDVTTSLVRVADAFEFYNDRRFSQ